MFYHRDQHIQAKYMMELVRKFAEHQVENLKHTFIIAWKSMMLILDICENIYLSFVLYFKTSVPLAK